MKRLLFLHIVLLHCSHLLPPHFCRATFFFPSFLKVHELSEQVILRPRSEMKASSYQSWQVFLCVCVCVHMHHFAHIRWEYVHVWSNLGQYVDCHSIYAGAMKAVYQETSTVSWNSQSNRSRIHLQTQNTGFAHFLMTSSNDKSKHRGFRFFCIKEVRMQHFKWDKGLLYYKQTVISLSGFHLKLKKKSAHKKVWVSCAQVMAVQRELDWWIWAPFAVERGEPKDKPLHSLIHLCFNPHTNKTWDTKTGLTS